MDCIFCKIIEKKIPSQLLHEDEKCIAFKDIHPQAKVHFLVVPKKHIPTLLDVGSDNSSLMGHLISVGTSLATRQGIAKTGFRVVINCNQEGGQTVYHLHLHFIGGNQLGGSMVG